MATILERSPARTCFNGLHQLVCDAMARVLGCGIFSHPFDWSMASREKPGTGGDAWYFTPDDEGRLPIESLNCLERLTLRGPAFKDTLTLKGVASSTVMVSVVLDARDVDGKQLRPMLDRGSWGESRRYALVILRHWIQTADDQLAALKEKKGKPPKGTEKKDKSHGNCIAARNPAEANLRALIVERHKKGQKPSAIFESLSGNKDARDLAAKAGVSLRKEFIDRTIDQYKTKERRLSKHASDNSD